MNKIKIPILTCLLAILLSTGCSLSEQNNTESKKEASMKKSETPTNSDKQKQAGLKHSNPTVSTTQANASKPISESEGSATAREDGELYIVPNRFPIEEKEELERQEEKRKKEEAEKQKPKDPPN
jgi:flagellum-specific peptidoglycan hydrolase FlgJ